MKKLLFTGHNKSNYHEKREYKFFLIHLAYFTKNGFKMVTCFPPFYLTVTFV